MDEPNDDDPMDETPNYNDPSRPLLRCSECGEIMSPGAEVPKEGGGYLCPDCNDKDWWDP